MLYLFTSKIFESNHCFKSSSRQPSADGSRSSITPAIDPSLSQANSAETSATSSTMAERSAILRDLRGRWPHLGVKLDNFLQVRDTSAYIITTPHCNYIPNTSPIEILRLNIIYYISFRISTKERSFFAILSRIKLNLTI